MQHKFKSILTEQDNQIIKRMDAIVLTLHAGESVIFRAKFPHAANNLATGTLSSHSILLTMDTIGYASLDSSNLPIDEIELGWFVAVLRAVYRQLSAHLFLQVVLDKKDLRSVVVGLQQILKLSEGRRNTFSDYFAKQEFTISQVEAILREPSFQEFVVVPLESELDLEPDLL